MKQELKRCPCCGGYTKYEYKDERERDGIRKYVRAACQNCGISTLYHPLCDLLSAFPDKYSPMFPQDYEPYDGEEIVAKEWNRRVEQEVIDDKNNVMKDFKPNPSLGGTECSGNGKYDIECQCDECEHFLTCFPYTTKNL